MNDIQKYLDRTHQTFVEAAQLTHLNVSKLASWAQAHQIPYPHTQDPLTTPISLHIYGRTKMLIAKPGDWIIKHPGYDYEVIPDTTFTEQYETA